MIRIARRTASWPLATRLSIAITAGELIDWHR